MLAYFSDTSTPENRSLVFVRGEAVIFLGFAIGPYVGGILTRMLSNGAEKVVIMTLVGEVLSMLYIIFILPESLPAHERKLNVKPSVTESLKTTLNYVKSSSRSLLVVILTSTVFSAAIMGGKSLFFYYAAFKFGWDALDEGQYMLVSSGYRMVYMLLVFPMLTSMFGKLRKEPLGRALFDVNLVRLCFVVAALSNVAMATVTKGEWVYAVSLVECFSILGSPTLRTLVSNSVPSALSAQVFAGVQFCEQILGMILGFIFPIVWTKTINVFPGFFLLLLAFCFALSVLVLSLANPAELVPIDVVESDDESL